VLKISIHFTHKRGSVEDLIKMDFREWGDGMGLWIMSTEVLLLAVVTLKSWIGNIT
jgi:hypothetical protein